MSKVTHVIVELDNPTDSKWLRYGINDEYYGEGKPLIMCKDCKYHINGECEMWDYISTADDYWCKDGERREERGRRMIKDAVINAFNRFYEEALKRRWIKKKLSWALYQTWKWCDANEEEE